MLFRIGSTGIRRRFSDRRCSRQCSVASISTRSKEPARPDATGRGLHRDPLVVAAIADVDVTAVLRAPHPALRIAIPVVAIPVVVVVVAVMVMAVAIVMMPAMAAVMAVAAVMAMTAVMTMTTAVAATAARRRVTYGGDRRDRQRDRGSSGCEHSTLHSDFSLSWSRATIALDTPAQVLKRPKVL
jgi:hypothetical protein